jgi:hypothetical protein
VVGCGYAAHLVFGPDRSAPEPQRGFRLIRLADGVTWDVLTNTVLQTWAFRFDYPLAITCDEVFVEVLRGNALYLARVRIDSLGPGTPPD